MCPHAHVVSGSLLAVAFLLIIESLFSQKDSNTVISAETILDKNHRKGNNKTWVSSHSASVFRLALVWGWHSQWQPWLVETRAQKSPWGCVHLCGFHLPALFWVPLGFGAPDRKVDGWWAVVCLHFLAPWTWAHLLCKLEHVPLGCRTEELTPPSSGVLRAQEVNQKGLALQCSVNMNCFILLCLTSLISFYLPFCYAKNLKLANYS